mgnify:CR=1 FL=1|tara:strand:- start:737 stop:1027 length:291 start_codon:yes stop_codon:yes gene_type:complete
MSRVVPNKLVKTRAEIEGRAYRMISFFHSYPSEIPEEGWTVFEQGENKFIVDKLTLSVMAECQCEFLSREADSGSDEPAIVSVKMDLITEKEEIKK